LINSYKTESIVNTHVANGITTTATDIAKQDLTNFLLAIPLTVDSTRMESVTRTFNDATWITNGIIQITSFREANDVAATCVNVLAPRSIVFSRGCD
jgi:hypothetical protein